MGKKPVYHQKSEPITASLSEKIIGMILEKKFKDKLDSASKARIKASQELYNFLYKGFIDKMAEFPTAAFARSNTQSYKVNGEYTQRTLYLGKSLPRWCFQPKVLEETDPVCISHKKLATIIVILLLKKGKSIIKYIS